MLHALDRFAKAAEHAGSDCVATRPRDVVSQRKPPRRSYTISAEGSVMNHRVRIEAGTPCEAEPAVRADGTQ